MSDNFKQKADAHKFQHANMLIDIGGGKISSKSDKELADFILVSDGM